MNAWNLLSLLDELCVWTGCERVVLLLDELLIKGEPFANKLLNYIFQTLDGQQRKEWKKMKSFDLIATSLQFCVLDNIRTSTRRDVIIIPLPAVSSKDLESLVDMKKFKGEEKRKMQIAIAHCGGNFRFLQYLLECGNPDPIGAIDRVLKRELRGKYYHIPKEVVVAALLRQPLYPDDMIGKHTFDKCISY
ncbi:hypothetical protein ROZALSC1DRAFT_26043, partial [Rozella allomycis CSF55]